MSSRCATSLLLALAASACSLAPASRLFYRPDATAGSQWAYDPLANNLQYILDGVQVDSFETNDYGADLGKVLDHLGSPFHQIRDEGGTRRFVNTEIFPVDRDHLDDSKAILPNVALHGLGGGMLFRKDAEWLAAHDVPAPYLVAGALAMGAEILAEAIEKPAADDTDEVADVWIWRPLGLLLYGTEAGALWTQEHLDPVDWPYQLVWDVGDGRFRNTGMNYVFRPPALGTDTTRLFAFTGMTNLFGLSHTLGNGDTFSWGAGAATETIEPVVLRAAGGLFWERDRSLLGSLIVHGAEGYAVRLNVHPGVLAGTGTWLGRAGFFAGVTDGGDFVFGVQWGLPIGAGG